MYDTYGELPTTVRGFLAEGWEAEPVRVTEANVASPYDYGDLFNLSRRHFEDLIESVTALVSRQKFLTYK